VGFAKRHRAVAVIDTLERGRAAGPDRQVLRNQLLSAPWCWPLTTHPAISFAMEVAGVKDSPTITPGICAGVTVWDESTVTLWRLESGPNVTGEGATLDEVAQRAWKDVGCAIPRSVPLLWDSVARTSSFEPRACRIDSWSPDATSVREQMIEGPSFGLSFALLLASRLLDTPVPEDIIASAAVNADGEVRPVNDERDDPRRPNLYRRPNGTTLTFSGPVRKG
jgi:hypothetical protein